MTSFRPEHLRAMNDTVLLQAYYAAKSDRRSEDARDMFAEIQRRADERKSK